MRVLGLDISSNAVAVLEMDSAFGRFEIRDTHETAFDPAIMSPPAAAQQLLNSLPRLPDRLVTTIPGDISTFRNLVIATKDKKAIRNALEFELEDDLPFETNNLHYDSVTLAGQGTGSIVHVAAVKKSSFGQHLNELRSFGIDPDVITSEAWAYRSLFSRLNQTDPVLLFGMEQEKSFFYIHYKNRPIIYKEIGFGLRTIELYLAEKLSANEQEISTWIQDVGVSGIDEQISNAISDVLETLLPEIKQTELAARAALKASIDQIYVTGAGALMPGFLNWLESATEKKVSLFRPLSQISPSQVTYSEVTEIRYAKALGLALSIVPVDKIQPINLRKGLFARVVAGGNNLFDLIKKPLPYIAIVTAVFFVTKSVEFNYYSTKVSDTNDTLKKAVKNYFGGISDSAVRSYISDPEKLKKNIQKDVAKERELSKLFVPNPNSPLDLLKSLSQKISKDIVMDMVHFDAGTDNQGAYKENAPLRTSLTVVVSNPQVLAKLSDTIEKNFNLKHGPSEELTQDGRKLIKVVYSGTIGGAKQ
jgi:Tfp pilus assembly PilM family ATPase